MQTYEKPIVEDLGTVAELTQALGFGPGSDSSFPLLAELEDRFPAAHDFITHS